MSGAELLGYILAKGWLALHDGVYTLTDKGREYLLRIAAGEFGPNAREILVRVIEESDPDDLTEFGKLMVELIRETEG